MRQDNCDKILASAKMETSLQNYFWMVDRLSMEDDARNKVNAETETV